MAKVLLVEDDNNLREIYQARLAAEGYDIVAAQNGEEALVIAKQNKPDLIISDVMMPRISGFEMLDILRNTDELKSTKVIMLTALGQAEDQARADNLGADKYLVKSQVTLEDIVNAAKELLGDDGAAVPAATEPGTASGAAAPKSLPTASTPEPAVSAPAESSSAAATPVETAMNVPAPTSEAPVVPASVTPQANTTVVVPPAPANPTPPTVTVTPLPADDIAVPNAPATSSTDEPAVSGTTGSITTDTPATSTASTPSPTVDTSAATAASQPLEAEEAAVQNQIDNFAAKPETTPPAAVDPEPTNENNASNDAAMATAVEELNSPSATPPEPSAPESTPKTPVAITVSAPAEEAPETPETTPTAPIATSLGGTKVIQPLSSSTPGPSLDELLAKEEASEPAAPVVNGQAGQPATTTPPATPGQTVDPNSISL